MHVAGYRSGNPFGALRPRTRVGFINAVVEQCQPTCKVSSCQYLLAMQLSMDIHGMPLVLTAAQQQLGPVQLNVGQVHLQVHFCYIKKNGRQLFIDQYPGLKFVDKVINPLLIVEVWK